MPEKITETNVKIALVELIKDSTAHGFPKVFKTERTFTKIMWTLFTLAAMGACAFFVMTTLTDYFAYNVTTVIRMQSKIPLDFPAVSICNANGFITKSSNDYLNSLLQQGYNIALQMPEFTFEKVDSTYQMSGNLTSLDYLSKLNALNDFVTESMRKSFGYSLEQIMFKCTFAGKTCKPSDFEWYYSVLHGNCFVFNSGKNGSILKQSKSGGLDGLQLELLNRFDDNLTNLVPYYGFHVKIFDQNTKPDPFVGIDIQTNIKANIQLSKILNTQMESPYSECLSDMSGFNSQIYKATLNYTKTYSRSVCYTACFQDFLIRACNCSDPNVPYLREVGYCLKREEILCEFINYVEFFQKNDVSKMCSEDCPLECQRTYYEYSMSYHGFPTESYANLLLKLEKIKNVNSTFDLDRLKRNILGVNIFYDSLEYQSIEELAQMSNVDVISNVGGLMGLFIGISFLSLIEILEMFFEIFFILFYKKQTLKTKVQNFEKY